MGAGGEGDLGGREIHFPFRGFLRSVYPLPNINKKKKGNVVHIIPYVNKRFRVDPHSSVGVVLCCVVVVVYLGNAFIFPFFFFSRFS